MNRARLSRSLELVRRVNELRAAWHRVQGCKCGCAVVVVAEHALRDHDKHRRDDPRQLTIWDAIVRQAQ